MFGTDPGTLNLWMDDYTQNGQTLSQINRMLIWKANGSKGKKWLQGRKTIKADQKLFKITFEGVLGKTYSEATIGNFKANFNSFSWHFKNFST